MADPKLRDVRKLADSRAVFELDIPLTELPGFPVEFLVAGGEVHAHLSFGREQGYAAAQVGLQADLTAICQRCLAEMPLRVDSSSQVLIVESEQDGEAAPAGWETFLAPEGRLVFAALVAEELLLALPIVPLHAEASQCQALRPELAAIAPAPDPTAASAQSAAAEATTRPFANLKTLLESGAKNQ